VHSTPQTWSHTPSLTQLRGCALVSVTGVGLDGLGVKRALSGRVPVRAAGGEVRAGGDFGGFFLGHLASLQLPRLVQTMHGG
jgi:hypothetical protein